MYSLFQPNQGKTTNEEWKTIKNNPAPWGELEIPDTFIMTFPSDEMRAIENMEEVANWHADAMKHFVDLMGTSKMQITERLVWDIQISAGIIQKTLFYQQNKIIYLE